MEYIRIRSIQDPIFKQMHRLMQQTFPPEEVLEFSLWEWKSPSRIQASMSMSMWPSKTRW
jgi:hypothetical protein